MQNWFNKKLLFLLLSFILIQIQANPPAKIYDLSKYGVKPNTGENFSLTINKIFKEIVADAGKDSSIVKKKKKGRYDFHSEGALKKEYYISNHDQDNPKTVAIALEDYHNITIDGQGSDFIFLRICPLFNRIRPSSQMPANSKERIPRDCTLC